LQLGHEAFLIFREPWLQLLPCSWAILVFYAYDLVDGFIDISLVFFGDFYPCFFEDLFKMPEIACQGIPPEMAIGLLNL
jgi:hypothetical protein